MLHSGPRCTHWKDGGLESPIPPVLSIGGGAKLVGVTTDWTSEPLKSSWQVSDDTNCKERHDEHLKAQDTPVCVFVCELCLFTTTVRTQITTDIVGTKNFL